MDKYEQTPPHSHFDPERARDGLDNGHVEALAQRVVELLRTDDRESAARRFVDAATLAAELGVERSWVYEHANELHPIRLGTGPKARLRFDALALRAAFAAQDLTRPRSSTGADETNERASARRARRVGRPKRTVGRVLAVRPRGAS